MKHDLRSVPRRGSLYLVGDVISLNREGHTLVASIRNGSIAVDAVVGRVREYLVKHGKGVGSHDISTARLQLFRQLHKLNTTEIADRLEQILTSADTQHRETQAMIAGVDASLRSLFDHFFR